MYTGTHSHTHTRTYILIFEFSSWTHSSTFVDHQGSTDLKVGTTDFSSRMTLTESYINAIASALWSHV